MVEEDDEVARIDRQLYELNEQRLVYERAVVNEKESGKVFRFS